MFRRVNVINDYITRCNTSLCNSESTPLTRCWVGGGRPYVGTAVNWAGRAGASARMQSWDAPIQATDLLAAPLE